MKSVKDFAAKGDGISDDTEACQNFLNSLKAGDCAVWPQGTYCVTHLEFKSSQVSHIFQNSRIMGVATSPQESIITFHNFRHANVENFFCISDGNALNPVYIKNYRCAVRFKSSSYGSPTQFNNFTGSFKIWYVPDGIVHGNFVEEQAQDPFPQSENFIEGFSVRGVCRPYYSNAENSYITFLNPIFAPQKFEASSWWEEQEDSGYCLRNDVGVLVSIGGEYQRAIQKGYSIYGKDITISCPVWEVSCASYITGTVILDNVVNGYFGVSGIPAFVVDSSAKGRLVLSKMVLHKPTGTAEYDRSRLVDCSNNNDFSIELLDSVFSEFSCSSNTGLADLVHGGELIARNTKIINSGPTQKSFTLDTTSNVLNTIDSSGTTLGNGLQTGGGWAAEGTSGAFGKNSVNTPPNTNCYIRIETSSIGGYSISTFNKFKVEPNKDYTLDGWLRGYGEGVGMSVNIKINWFDFNGTSISTDSIIFMSLADIHQNGFFGKWSRVRGYCKCPATAQFAKLSLSCGPNTVMGFSGIALRG